MAKRKKSWERGMPNPPSRVSVLREIVLEHIRWAEPRQMEAIHQAVVDDYGHVVVRTVFRHIAWWTKRGEVVKVSDPSEGLYGYVRARRPRWDEEAQVYV